MADIPQITFGVRHDGYGQLVLDRLAKVFDRSRTRKAAGTIQCPPRRTPVADQSDSQRDATTGLNRTWYIYLEDLAKKLQASGGLAQLKFACPSIDEEDILAGGIGTLDASANPATFTPNLTPYYSRFGVTCAVGDYIVWLDAVSGTAPAFEIDRIATINGADWTVERGHFKSPVGAHANTRFLRLESKVITRDLVSSELPDLIAEPWANKCVTAIRSWGVGIDGTGLEYTLNLSSATVPGYRTLNGAAYVNIGIAGDLAVNQRAGARIRVQAWESIRCLYGTVKTPPAGGPVTVAVVYIAPGDIEADREVGLIGRFTIPAGSYTSFLMADPPDGRQMPYDGAYPPNLLEDCGTLGALTAPVAATAGTPIVFGPDGEIDLIVEAIGSGTAGADLSATVQT